MAQFDYKRASLSTSEDMYKIGKSYFCYLNCCRPKASKLMMSQLGERTSVKEYSLGRWLLSSGSRKFNKPKSSASVCSPSRFEDVNFLPIFYTVVLASYHFGVLKPLLSFYRII